MDSIQLPRPLVNQLLHLAQSSPEDEVCGLISIDAHQHFTLYPISNIAAHPDNRFALDPKQQIDAMRTMRESGENLFAIYHSHPHATAEPSQLDLDEAAYPEALYLIISLNTEGVLEMQGFFLRKNETIPVHLDLF